MANVRVSVGNLAWYAAQEGGLSTSVFGILNPKKLKKGERQYGALGGAAMLNDTGKKYLEDSYGATDFEFDAATAFWDARFVIDDAHLEDVLSLFADTHGPVQDFEQSRALDIVHELIGQEVGHEPILTAEEAAKITVRYLFSVRQRPSEATADTSARASANVPTRRIFRIFLLIMPKDIYEKFAESPVVRILAEEELATTDGGSKAGVTDDGCVIQNNLFICG